MIIEEGQTVPADAKVVCDYDNREDGWNEYKQRLDNGELAGGTNTKSEDDDQEDDEPNTHGHSIASCDHSAITGESLAVDRYVGGHGLLYDWVQAW